MVVPVRNLDALVEGLSPVHRLEEVDVQAVHGVLVRGVGVDMNVVPGALPQVRVPVDAPEGIASVVGAVYPALVSLGLEEDEDPVRIRGRDGDARPADDALGKTALDLLPGIAGVGAAIDAVVLAPRHQGPWLPLRAPGRREEVPRVRRIHREVDDTRLVADVKDLLPALASVLRAKDPALFARPEDVPQRGDVHQFRIARVNADLADLPRLAKTDVLPGLARVGGLVDAVADGDVPARTGRARSHVDHVRIRRRDGDGADGAHAEEAVGHVRPGVPGVEGLEHAAPGAAEVVDERLPRDAGDRGRSPAAGESDVAELQAGKERRIDLDVRRILDVVVVASLPPDEPGAGGHEERGDECEGSHFDTPVVNRSRVVDVFPSSARVRMYSRSYSSEAIGAPGSPPRS